MEKVIQLSLTKEEAVLLLNAASAANLTALLRPQMILDASEIGPDVVAKFQQTWQLFLDVRRRMTVERWNTFVDQCNMLMAAAFADDDEVIPIDPNPVIEAWRERRRRERQQ